MARNLFELLRDTARRVPENRAYAGLNETMNFRQLYQSALSVASCTAWHIPVQQPVAILMDARSALCIPVMMGVLASGCFYAPLDPTLPEDRLRLILSNLRPALIIADEKEMEKAKAAAQDAILLTAEEALQAQPDTALVERRCTGIHPDDLAMVLYTSGSTGIPKGVQHTHRAMLIWTETTINKYHLTERDILANQSPWYYANSLLELFVPIQVGASVVMIPPSYLSFPKHLIRYLQEEHVTELCMTPSSFVAVANSGVLEDQLLPEMTLFIMSGEVMPKAQLRQWMKAAPNAQAMNFYGSTETLSVAVDPVCFPENGGVIPVGRLLPGVGLRLIREDGTEAAEGQMGEMYIQSPMVTVGYYGDAERTKSSLVADPLRQADGLWFRTGDYGILKNGALSVVGRKDSMIKHHGYRMELGEVEMAVRSMPGCREACCLYQQEKDAIWCFLAGDLKEEQIQSYLKGKLAKYMLPDRYMILDAMPHNANMKIDRAVLKRRMES